MTHRHTAAMSSSATALSPADTGRATGSSTTATLPYDPDAAEVVTLIEAHLNDGLVREEDQSVVTLALSELRLGKIGASITYSTLIAAIRRGPGAARCLELLDTLFRPNDVIELRAIRPNGGSTSYSGRLGVGTERSNMQAFVSGHMGTHNLYFGINPRVESLANTSSAANAIDVVARRYVVLDLDNKDAPDTDLGWGRTVTELKSQNPQMIVRSGNGWHVWFAIEPIETTETMNQVTPILAQAMAAVGADNISDLPRIIRLPGTINVPTEAKRRRRHSPARLTLSSAELSPNPQASLLSASDVCHHIEAVARSLKLPGRPGGRGGIRTGRWTNALSGHNLAPSSALLTHAIAVMPNTEHMDRSFQVRFAHAVKGAALGSAFEAEARGAFLDWSSRWTWGGDPIHDEKLYDGIARPNSGWPQLCELLGEHNRAGRAEVERLEAPHRSARARAAFSTPEAREGLIEMGFHNEAPPSSAVTDDPRLLGADSEATRPAKDNLVMRAMNALVQQGGATFFGSPDGKSWIKLAGRIYLIDEAKGCRAALSWLVTGGIVVTGNAKSALKDHMLARASAVPKELVFYRQADQANCSEAWINLMDDQGLGVHITAHGWHVLPVSRFPVNMANRDYALPLPVPIRAKDGVSFLDRIGRHIRLDPVQNANDPFDAGVQQRAVLLMSLLAQIYRPGAVPHLLITGPQGASKTTTARRLKGLTDPDTADIVTSLPERSAEIFAIGEQQSNIVVDNVSTLRDPDLLSALATGAASQQRELYSNGGRVVFRLKLSLIFTTILTNVTKRPDLMDRALRLDLPALDRSDRRTEAALNAAWDADLPYLLAGLLDHASASMARVDAVRFMSESGLIDPPPRLADAALIAEAAAQAAGWRPGLLLEAINGMRDSEAGAHLEESAVCTRVRDFLLNCNGNWSGSTSDLLNRLRFVDGVDNADWAHASSNVQAFSRALDRAAGPLREIWSIEVSRSRSNGMRRVALRFIDGAKAAAPPSRAMPRNA